MIKAIVFDLDDTLYDEIDYVKSGYYEVSKFIEKKYNIKNTNEIMWELFEESNKNIFNRLFEKLNIDYSIDDVNILIRIYKEHIPNIKLKDGAIQVLQFLKSKNIKTGIISDGTYITQENKIKSLNLEKYVDYIILTDSLGKKYWKPNRKSYDIMAKKFNIKLNEMIYVGDNPNKDFYCGKYGIITVRIYNKKGIYKKSLYLKDIKENITISNLYELQRIIKMF